VADRKQAGGLGEALNAWVVTTLPRATAYARSLLGDAGQADDVVHDCYCRLLVKRDEYDLIRDGTKLLYKAITNASIDQRRRDKGWVSLDEAMLTTGTARTSDSEEPIRLAMRREFDQALKEGLAKLPLLQRAAVELKSLGYSQREIAEALDVSPTNAGVLVHRGRECLAKLLGGHLEDKVS
jgi:RNA polymerase sigma factor (sigma-70 family)